MKRKEQLALLSAEQLTAYKKNVKFAVMFGLAQLWTFPLFSWPTIYPFIYAAMGHDDKRTGLALVFGSFIPLFILAAIFGFSARRFQRAARDIRLNAHAPVTDESNTLNT